MKTILSIGLSDYLFPDPTSAARVLAALQKAQVCRFRYDAVEVGIGHDFEAMLELKVLPPRTKFVKRKNSDDEPDEEIAITPKRPRAQPALAGTPRLFLEG